MSLWLNNEKWIEEIHSTKIWVNRTFYIHAAHKVVKVLKNHLQDWKLMKVFLDGIFSYSPATIIGIFAPNERGKNDNKVGSSLLCIDIIFLLSSYFYFDIAQTVHFSWNILIKSIQVEQTMLFGTFIIQQFTGLGAKTGFEFSISNSKVCRVFLVRSEFPT